MTLGQLTSDDLRVIKEGLDAEDRVIVNGLMRARPGSEGHAGGAGATPAPRRAAGAPQQPSSGRQPMRISHFFIDRPIFASVVSIVFVILGGVSLLAAADRAISGDRAADHHRDRASIPAPAPKSSPRLWWRRSSSRSTASKTCFICRRTRPRDGTVHDLGDLRYRHQPRYRAGAGAEPCLDRPAAPAGGRAQYRRHGRQEFARPDDGRASVFAGQIARHAVHFQLRHTSRSTTR